jgi:hsp70-interacting protein
MIESIDNANDMQKLGLWPPLVKLLEDSSDQIRQQAAWVAGTAVQNNPKAQEAVCHFFSSDLLRIHPRSGRDVC